MSDVVFIFEPPVLLLSQSDIFPFLDRMIKVCSNLGQCTKEPPLRLGLEQPIRLQCNKCTTVGTKAGVTGQQTNKHKWAQYSLQEAGPPSRRLRVKRQKMVAPRQVRGGEAEAGGLKATGQPGVSA